MRAALYLALLVAASGCDKEPLTFVCADSSQCAGGMCIDGACAFASSDCSSGYRFDPSATGGRGSQCASPAAGGDDLGTTDDLASGAGDMVPATLPGAPTSVTASGGDGSATLTWMAPSSDGGSAIISYVVTASPGGATTTAGGTALSTQVTGLTNGTSYTFTVSAVNAVGAGPTATSNSVTPTATPVAPTAPTSVTAAINGPLSMIVTWQPSDNGGSPITGFTIQSSPATTPVNVSGTAASATISGLTASQSYTFTVTATNAVGTSPASAPSAAVTAANVPGTPTGVTATATTGYGATVQWTAPSANGAAITSYTVTASPGNLTQTSTTTSATLSSLTAGQSYTFTVTATNAAGTGGASSASNAIVAGDVPGAPGSVSASANIPQGATVTWSAAAANGSAITSYTVSWSGATSGQQTAAASATSAMVGGLTVGGTYTFTVVANNGFGAGTAASSGQVTILDVPAAPTGVAACGADSQMTITFNASAGATSYNLYYSTSSTVSPTNGTKVAGVTSPYILKSLTNGTIYYVVVTAIDSVGESAASASAWAKPDSVVHDTLFTTNYGNNTIEIFDCASAMPANAAPTRKITGAATTLNLPYGLFVDKAGATIYVTNQNANSVVIFADATRVDGAATPSRTVVGNTTTKLNTPEMIYVDLSNGRNRMYVSNYGTSSVLVFNNATTINGGTAAPVATPSAGFPEGVTIDETTDTMFVTEDTQIGIFKNASTLTGSSVASATMTINDVNNPTTQQLRNLAFDQSKHLLYVPVAVYSTLYSFANASTLSGSATPTTTISTPSLFNSGVYSVGVANDTLFGIYNQSSPVPMWNNVSTATGSQPPNKTLTGAASGNYSHAFYVF